MRFLVVFTVLMVGCVATLPSDPTISADLAVELGRGVVQLRVLPANVTKLRARRRA